MSLEIKDRFSRNLNCSLYPISLLFLLRIRSILTIIFTLGEDYNDFKIAAASIKCSTDSLPAIAICKTPITLPRSASS